MQHTSYLAHRDIDDDGTVFEQTLVDHLLDTADLAREAAAPLPLAAAATVLGLLHDIGKGQGSFQARLLGKSKSHVNHSSAGACYLLERIFDLEEDLDLAEENEPHFIAICECLTYVITAHHGLYDFITMRNGELGNLLYLRLKWQEEPAYEREIRPFIETDLDQACRERYGQSIDDFIKAAFFELLDLRTQLGTLATQSSPSDKARDAAFAFYEACTVRLLLSILKEADMYNSANCFAKDPQARYSQTLTDEIFQRHADCFNTLYAGFAKAPNPSPLNQERSHLADLGNQHALEHASGLFRYHLPTGAGKTLAGTRYAVSNVLTHHKRRFFYVTSFLTVLEQSAREIKKLLGDENVLEHHSNIAVEIADKGDGNTGANDTREDDLDYNALRKLFDHWEFPVIFTTMVQWTNVLFSGRASQIRRFAKLIDSTIIIDEIQNLPVGIIYPMNLMQNFLAHVMHVTLIHCSATQPPYDNDILAHRLLYGDATLQHEDIVPNGAINEALFDRTVVRYLSDEDKLMSLATEDVIDALDDLYDENDSFLIVCNTKHGVKTLRNAIKKAFPDDIVIYLTTNLCAQHRLDLIDTIKKHLERKDAKEKLFCIATNLVEAGVDFDFNVVVRAITGIDSILQAAGRCNRNGNMAHKGQVFIMRYSEDTTSAPALRDIRDRGDVSAEALRVITEEPFNMKALQDYFYDKYFLKKANDMVCKITTLGSDASYLDLLSLNERVQQECIEQEGDVCPGHHLQALKTAAANWQLIKNYGISVLVPYRNDKALANLKEALEEGRFGEAKDMLRRLQRYTVNLAASKGTLAPCIAYTYSHPALQEDIIILQADCYNDDLGVVTDVALPDLMY